eukprot:2973090-Amphidinium_carterae.1
MSHSRSDARSEGSSFDQDLKYWHSKLGILTWSGRIILDQVRVPSWKPYSASANKAIRHGLEGSQRVQVRAFQGGSLTSSFSSDALSNFCLSFASLVSIMSMHDSGQQYFPIKSA